MRHSYLLGSAVTLLAGVSAHTWVEQLVNIADDGSYFGAPGYIRSYVPRGSSSFSDAKMSFLAPQGSRPRVSDNDMLCHPNQQATTQSSDFPSLATAPGNTIALRYLENGHVSLPDNQPGKPASGGLVYIYATTRPKPNEKLVNVLQWTPEGSLEDGRLLNINPYDDGRCYQVNGASSISVQRQAEFPNAPDGGANRELWCQNNVQIPQDAAEDLTMYWVWQWPTQPGIDPGLPVGKDEIYTSCMDVRIINDEAVLKNAVAGVDLGSFQDNTPALPDFKQRLANATLPANPVFYGPGSSFNGGAPSQPPSQGTPGEFAPQPPTPTTMQTSATPITTPPPSNPQDGVVYVTVTVPLTATVTVTDDAPGVAPTTQPDNAQGTLPENGQNGRPDRPRGGRARGNSAKFRR